MALGDIIYMHGFEGGDAAKDGLAISTSGGTVTATATNKRTGDYCLRVNRTSAAMVFARAITGTAPALPSGYASTSMAVYMYIGTLPSSKVNVIFGQPTTGNSFNLTLAPTGQTTIMTNLGATESTNIATLSAGQGYLIEFHISNSTTTGVYRCRINGGNTFEVTQSIGATGSLAHFGLGSNSTSDSTYDLYYDDLVIVESQPAANGAYYPGDHRIVALRPSSDLDSNWTPNTGIGRAAQIDEHPPDDATTYISSIIQSQGQRVNLGDVSIPGTIKAAQPVGRMGSDGTASPRYATVNLRNGTGGTDGTLTNWDAVVAGWKNHSTWPAPLMNVPGGTGWTQTDLNNLVLRFIKNAENTYPVYITSAYVQVAYTPSASGGTFSDNFNRGSLGTNWADPIYSGDPSLIIVANQLAAPVTGWGSSYWAQNFSEATEELIITVTGVDNTSEPAVIGLVIKGSNFNSASINAYVVELERVSAGTFTLYLSKLVNGTKTVFGSVTGIPLSNGDKLRVRHSGNSLSAWQKQTTSNKWVKRAETFSANEAAMANGGFVGVTIFGLNWLLDDAAGGGIVGVQSVQPLTGSTSFGVTHSRVKVSTSSDFPATPVLDNFNRANGGLGANWSSPIVQVDGANTVISNQTGNDGSSSQESNWWNTAFATGTHEVYAQVPVLPTSAHIIYLIARLTNPNSPSNFSGYFIFLTNLSGSSYYVSLIRRNAGTDVELANTTLTLSAGDWLGMRVSGTNPVDVKVFRKPLASGWNQSPIVTASDSSASRLNPSSSFLGIRIQGAPPRLDEFGGGLAIIPTSHTRGLTGSLSFAGAPRKSTRRPRTGSVSFTGSTKKRTSRSRAGALSFTGLTKKRTNRRRTGTLSFTGAIKRANRKKLLASFSPVGAIKRRSTRKIAASLTSTGVIKRRTARRFGATLPLSGFLTRVGNFAGIISRYSLAVEEHTTGAFFRIERRELDGLYTTLSTAYIYNYVNGSKFGLRATGSNPVKLEGYHKNPGELWKRVITADDASALRHNPLNPSKSGVELPNVTIRVDDYGTGSAIAAFFIKALIASLDFGTSIKKRTARKLAATVGFDGLIKKRAQKALVASIAFSTLLKRQTGKAIAASLGFVGSTSKRTNKTLVAALSFSASHLVGNQFVRALTASLSFTTGFKKSTFRLLAGTLAFAGSVKKHTARMIAASLFLLGNITLPDRKRFTAALDFTGQVTKRTARTFASSLGFNGALRKHTSRLFSAILSFTGTLDKSTIKALFFNSALTFTTELSRHTSRSYAAILSFDGFVQNFISRRFAPALSFTGKITRRTLLGIFPASISPIGALRARTSKALAATLFFTTALPRHITRTLTASLSFTGVLTKLRTAYKSLAASLSFNGVLSNTEIFPVEPILDDFNRADSTGLGTNWDGTIDDMEDEFDVVDNQATHQTSEFPLSAKRIEVLRSNQEAYVTVVDRGTVGTRVKVSVRIKYTGV